MPPIHLDVIALIPAGWGLCQPCEALLACARLGEAPAERDWDGIPPALQMEFRRLGNLLLDLSARYGKDLLIRIYDPYSLPGLWKSLRYRVRSYPTFVIGGKEKIAGWDRHRLESALERMLLLAYPPAQSNEDWLKE